MQKLIIEDREAELRVRKKFAEYQAHLTAEKILDGLSRMLGGGR